MKPQMDNTGAGVKKLSDSALPPVSAPMASSEVSSGLTKGFGMDGGLGRAKRHLAKQESGKFHKSRES